MDIGIRSVFGSSRHRNGAFIRDYAVAAEEIGFASLWAPEHVVFFSSYESKYPYTQDGSLHFSTDSGLYDPLMVCQAAAAATTHLRVATSVLIATERHPLLTAKQVMTLDHLTEGRFELGVGSGWSTEEYAALDVPFERRGKRLDEYIGAMKAAWLTSPSEFHGEFVDFTDVMLLPKPLTEPHPPILVGGMSKAAMVRAARLADGWYGWWTDDVDLESIVTRLREILDEEGRSNDSLFKIKLGRPPRDETPDVYSKRVEQARSLGVQEFVVGAPISSRNFEPDLRLWASAAGL